MPRRKGMMRLHPVLAWSLTLALVALAAGGAILGAVMAPTPPPGLTLYGTIRAPDGPFLYDRYGRVVFLHGVNVVYKYPPFEVYPDPHEPWNFGVGDARRIAALGFDVVRLGIMWQGLEPGTDPPNDPQICEEGRPRNPHQLDLHVLFRYLDRLRVTVDLLGRFHIYSLLDMHQDVYNQMFEGEGEPSWAVCTDDLPSVFEPGRWSLEYGSVAAGIAFHHFWTNNVVGDLQGQYDEVWGYVARFFRNNPWVIGYDPFNEPFSTSVLKRGGEHFDGQLECFYTGTAHVGGTLYGAPPIRCPKHDPRTGLIPTILHNDPYHLIFFEPDNYANRGYPTYIGPMDFRNLVFNIHVYCPERDPTTGNPTDLKACVTHDALAVIRHAEERPKMASRAQPRGPAWIITEFGATSSVPLLGRVTTVFNDELVGWIYWSWKYYKDPTGSTEEALVRATGGLRASARVLSQIYAEAVAGTPLSMSFEPATGAFDLRYRANHRIKVPTIVVVPTLVRYRQGYCPHASGGRVVSRPGSSLLEIDASPGVHVVDVSVRAGRCQG